ncbi:MAG: DUF3891 family protein [Pedobacter sp.]|uniref:DUF3891 family protein n=1 Tax=Pedobacter sp. TaxID=1411316 RepID=UPI00339949E3
MIVNYSENGWEIITQRSHGLLAAQICAQWRKDDQPKRWVETLIATAEHDDVYNEFENDNLLNDKGGPVNFINTGFEKDHCERLMGMAETKSAYIALLTSRHIQFIHAADPKAKSFIADLIKREKQWIIAAQSTQAEVKRGYAVLQFCDAFSLLICQGLVQPEHRKIEISSGPDGTVYQMFEQDATLIVEPWPFEEASFELSYESRNLPALTYRSTSQFRKAIAEAEVSTHNIMLRSNRSKD